MTSAFTGQKIAVLVGNGFSEPHLIHLQKAFIKTGGHVRLIGLDQGLVSGWNGENWGLNFAIDKPLKEALAADYAMLVVPGGQKSIEKLSVTAHTKRFVSTFIESRKPVVAIAEGLEILLNSEKLAARNVSGMASMQGDAERAGAIWVDGGKALDSNLMTLDDLASESDVDMILGFLASFDTIQQAA